MTAEGMFSRPTNPVSHRLARLAFFLACVAALIVAVCGPAHRFLGIDLDFVLIVFRYGFYAAAAAIAMALATVMPTRPGERRRGFVAAVLALVIGVAAAWSPAQWLLQARETPRINDVTTDTARPPAMVVTQQMRKGAANSPAYPGESAAILQRAAYPDIVPIVLAVAPAEAFKRVDRVAMALGWDVVARAPAEGRLEAVDTTDWFGLEDDIVVRVRAEGTTGSRVDIRSKSRLGDSDFGANARRIRAFTEELRAEQ
jgi:uncharacterized protein (DUF1499 family)